MRQPEGSPPPPTGQQQPEGSPPSPPIWQQPYPDEIGPFRATNITWKCLEEVVNSQYPTNPQMEYGLNKEDSVHVCIAWLKRYKSPEWTPEIVNRWLMYQYSVLMTKFLYIKKIPSEIYPTTINDRIAVVNRHTGPIITSSVNAA